MMIPNLASRQDMWQTFLPLTFNPFTGYMVYYLVTAHQLALHAQDH